MQGITIISSIIAAVCVFQTAEAGLLDDLTKSLPISFENLGIVEKATKSNSRESCTEVYNNGKDIINKVKTTFSTCFSNTTNPDTNKNIQNLIEAVNNLKSKIYEETAKCFNDILNITSCLAKEKARGLTSLLNKVVDAATEVFHMSHENMSECYKTAINKTEGVMGNFVQNVKDCRNSLVWLF